MLEVESVATLHFFVAMPSSEYMYKVGCREGKLAQRYSTADLDFVKEPLLKICDVPNIEIALHTAVGKTSRGQLDTRAKLIVVPIVAHATSET